MPQDQDILPPALAGSGHIGQSPQESRAFQESCYPSDSESDLHLSHEGKSGGEFAKGLPITIGSSDRPS